MSLIFLVYMHGLFLLKKKGVSIINASQSILGSSERKLNKIWVDQGREFCNSPFKNG